MPYWALTTSLNVIITILLTFRLMRMRRTVIETLGPDHAKLYTSVMSMIVESVVLYALFGLACIIMFAVGSNLLNMVEPVAGQVLCSPELIILRVAHGRAWTRDMTQSSGPGARRAFIVKSTSTATGKQLGASVPASTSGESQVDF